MVIYKKNIDKTIILYYNKFIKRKEVKIMTTINNMPSYAADYEFIVVTKNDDELWFYGAYADGFKAEKVASDIDGIIIHNVRIQGKKKN